MAPALRHRFRRGQARLDRFTLASAAETAGQTTNFLEICKAQGGVTNSERLDVATRL